MKISPGSVKGKKIAVLGCGVTGIGLANLLSDWGGHVSMYDESSEAGLKEQLERNNLSGLVKKYFGHMDKRALDGFSLVIKSPGVPGTIPSLQRVLSRGGIVVGELEVLSEYIPRPAVAITGTNGKTTVTTLVGKMLQRAGMSPFVGGNIGVSIAAAFPCLETFKSSVLEVSSFQLEDTYSFHPKVAVLLNITPDHLNRHADMDEYMMCKFRIFINQDKNDTAILNANDPFTPKLIRQLNSKVMLFSSSSRVADGAYVENGSVCFVDGGVCFASIALENISEDAVMNLENILPASVAALSLGVDLGVIQGVLSAFKSLPNRMEYVTSLGGVKFVNDSKATNIGALQMALRKLPGPIILIAGGQDKGGDYAELKGLVSSKVKKVFLIGEASEKIKASLCLEDAVFCSSLEDAVFGAYSFSETGDTVLLSPACASFDMFRSYAERGSVFKDLVMGMGRNSASFSHSSEKSV